MSDSTEHALRQIVREETRRVMPDAAGIKASIRNNPELKEVADILAHKYVPVPAHDVFKENLLAAFMLAYYSGLEEGGKKLAQLAAAVIERRKADAAQSHSSGSVQH